MLPWVKERMSSELKYKEGDRVVYHPTGAGNESVGIIKQILKEPPVSGATEEDYPRYVYTYIELFVLS